MRGEDEFAPPTGATALETPPHAWGRHSGASGQAVFLRNTPTCVGKTSIDPRSWQFGQKHPHMRGEDALPNVNMVESVETPPHAWGRRDYSMVNYADVGNTPTCVGKTQGRICI